MIEDDIYFKIPDSFTRDPQTQSECDEHIKFLVQLSDATGLPIIHGTEGDAIDRLLDLRLALPKSKS